MTVLRGYRESFPLLNRYQVELEPPLEPRVLDVPQLAGPLARLVNWVQSGTRRVLVLGMGEAERSL